MKREKNKTANIQYNLEKIARKLINIINKIRQVSKLAQAGNESVQQQQRTIHNPYEKELAEARALLLDMMNFRFVKEVFPKAKNNYEKIVMKDIYDKIMQLHDKYLDEFLVLTANHRKLYDDYMELLKKEKAKASDWRRFIEFWKFRRNDKVLEYLFLNYMTEWGTMKAEIDKDPKLSEETKTALLSYLRDTDPYVMYIEAIHFGPYSAEKELTAKYPLDPNTHPYVQRQNFIKALFHALNATSALGGTALGAASPTIPLPPHLYGIELDSKRLYAPEENAMLFDRRFIEELPWPYPYSRADKITDVLAHVAGDFLPDVILRLALGGAESLPTNVRKELRGNPEFSSDRFLPRPPYPDLPIKPPKK